MSEDDQDFASALAEFEQGQSGVQDRPPRVGERIEGTIVSIGSEVAFVELGVKSEGVVPVQELVDSDGNLEYAVGDSVGALLTAIDPSGGFVLRVRAGRGEALAEEIRDARTALGLTQSQLAELIGCAAESLSRWENGAILQSRSYDRLLRLFFHLPIARALLRGVGPTTQFGRIAVPGPSDPKPEILESMRILTRIWQGSADLVPSPKPQPRTSPVGGTAGHVWLEAQRHTPAERAAWGSSAALNASRTDVEWAAWEPS